MRLDDYEIFPNHERRGNGNLIEEVVMVEWDPIDHVQVMKDDNLQSVTNEEIKAIKKNKTWELFNYLRKKAIDAKCIYKLKLKENGDIDFNEV